jgi:3'(2'), 5'-bisphosphate nucleotidase
LVEQANRAALSGVESDVMLAGRIAESAARLLADVRASTPPDQFHALGDLGDRSAQEHIAHELNHHRPQDAVLSEEAQDSQRRLSAERIWIIDPLDGTREYSEGRDDWAVHVALQIRGRLAVGAVALGGPDTVLTTATVTMLPPRVEGPLRIAVSRSRPPRIVNAVADAIGAQLVPMGSAGVKVSSVVTGQVDAYVHGGGQYEWDSAAPVAVARAAGAHTSRLDGSPLVYNQPNPYLPDLVVCRPEVAQQLLDVISLALTADGKATRDSA